jgi:hypothetical protein
MAKTLERTDPEALRNWKIVDSSRTGIRTTKRSQARVS